MILVSSITQKPPLSPSVSILNLFFVLNWSAYLSRGDARYSPDPPKISAKSAPEKNTDKDSLKKENPEDIRTMSSLFFPKLPRATNAPINTMIGMNLINELGNFMRVY